VFVSKIAGIEGLIWKDLRATFGARLAAAGCDAFTIAQLLEHSDIRVTIHYVPTAAVEPFSSLASV
jgi:integrase